MCVSHSLSLYSLEERAVGSEREIYFSSVCGGVVRGPALATSGVRGGDGVFDTRRTQT